MLENAMAKGTTVELEYTMSMLGAMADTLLISIALDTLRRIHNQKRAWEKIIMCTTIDLFNIFTIDNRLWFTVRLHICVPSIECCV